MSSDWWPRPLQHIPAENPWEEDDVVVAEIRSFDEQPAGHRRTFSVLVPADEVDAVRKNLAGFNHRISASGPHPEPFPGSVYDPKFWVGAKGLPQERYEPLVLSWSSHDKTVLQLDPRFLMTYGLAPRATGDLVCWDDPARPIYDVAKVSAPSVWSAPLGTSAFVTIDRDYMQDYLTLRNMALVQVFWEIRWGNADDAIDKRLGGEEAIDIELPDRKFQLSRYLRNREIVSAQVWGGRVVALPGDLPITDDSLEKESLIWPGFEKPITNDVAAGMNASEQVYVNDGVLAKFEDRPEFQINPKTGSVSFGTQWSVDYCDRVGRNLIQLEIKKLYEGTPAHVTRHWNDFAVEPPSEKALLAARTQRNIAIRAEEVTYAVVSIGEALAALAQSVGLTELRPENFVGLKRRALEYSGWWTFEDTAPISRHVPLGLSADGFLDRCMSLNKLVVESLSESRLRQLLAALGVPADAIAKFGTLKLLDCIVRMAQVAASTGLGLSKDGKAIWDRLEREGTTPAQPIARLFALYDIRIVKAHKAGDRNKKLAEELERFDITTREAAAGYGKILDTIYDTLSNELGEASAKIEAVA
jgi:hypothetical protein